MATIEPYTTTTGQKRYRVRYRTPEHRQTDKRGFKTKRDAELFRATVEVGLARGDYIAPRAGRITVGSIGAEWIERQTHLKPSSLRPVESAWRIHVEPRWGRVAVSDVRTTAVQNWVAKLSATRSATTVARSYGVLAAILDDAVADKRLSSNPARGVKLPRKRAKDRAYLSHDQVAALARAAGRNSTLVLLLAYTGLRWGEATALRVRDVDLERRRLTVEQNAVESGSRIEVGTPKSNRRRTVPFPDFLTEALRAQCADDEGRPGGYPSLRAPAALVFRSRTDEHLRRGNAKDGWFVRAVRDSGVPHITPHDLRHTAASLAVSVGANVKAVQRMLGHASAAMTLDTYADLFDDDLDAVAVALNDAASGTDVGKLWARAPEAESGTAQDRWNSNESGPFDRAETVGFEPTEGLLPHILSRDAH